MGKKKAAKKWTKQDFGEITRPTIFDPGMVDKSIRQAVSLCWMMLPPEKRTPENIEAQIRRTVDRVLSDLKEDIAAFNITPNTSTQVDPLPPCPAPLLPIGSQRYNRGHASGTAGR